MSYLNNIPTKGTWTNIQSILTSNFQKLLLLLQGAENIDISIDGDYIKVTDKDGVEHSLYAKGNSGSSVDYPFELVNALTQATSGKALDAYQGKVIKELLDNKVNTSVVTELSQKVTDIEDSLISDILDNKDNELCVTDANGNVMFKIDNNGIDSAKVATHLVSILKSNMIDQELSVSSTNAVSNKAVKEALNAISVDGIIPDSQTKRLCITDSNGYMIAYIDSEGIHSVNGGGGGSANSTWKGKSLYTLGDSLSAGGKWQKYLVDNLGMVFDEVKNTTTNNDYSWQLAKGGRGLHTRALIKSIFVVAEYNPDVVILESWSLNEDKIVDGNAYHMTQFLEYNTTDLTTALASVPSADRKHGTIIGLGSNLENSHRQPTYAIKADADISDWTNTSNWKELINYGICEGSQIRGCIEYLQKKCPKCKIAWLFPTVNNIPYTECPSLYDDEEHINAVKQMDYFSGNATNYDPDASSMVNYKKWSDFMYKICGDMGVQVLDMWKHSGISFANNDYFYLINGSGVHPSNDGYKMWGEAICNLLV